LNATDGAPREWDWIDRLEQAIQALDVVLKPKRADIIQ
jgi:hypothetical protein